MTDLVRSAGARDSLLTNIPDYRLSLPCTAWCCQLTMQPVQYTCLCGRNIDCGFDLLFNSRWAISVAKSLKKKNELDHKYLNTFKVPCVIVYLPKIRS